jgi:hypothetical protein
MVLMVSLLLRCMVTKPSHTGNHVEMRRERTEKIMTRVSPNHFFEEPALSITSTRPGRSGSIDGTWFTRIHMSPVAADRLTCTTSVEVKITYHASEFLTAQQVQWGCEDAPGVEGREKALFCQLLRHSHDELRQKGMGHVMQQTQTTLRTQTRTRRASNKCSYRS